MSAESRPDTAQCRHGDPRATAGTDRGTAPDLAKMVKQEAEQGRVAIRNVRRDAINDIKELLKDKVINEDQERQGETMIQEITDKHVAEIEKISDEKQKEIMEF
jgi:ribosome recycling factor